MDADRSSVPAAAAIAAALEQARGALQDAAARIGDLDTTALAQLQAQVHAVHAELDAIDRAFVPRRRTGADLLVIGTAPPVRALPPPGVPVLGGVAYRQGAR